MEVKKEVKKEVKHFVLDNSPFTIHYSLITIHLFVLSFLTPMSGAN